MRYVLLACLLALALAFDLGVLIATSDDSFGSFDPYHPATLLPIVASHLHDLQSHVRRHVTELVDAVVAPYRAQIRREGLAFSEPQEM
jgi:hypothetical protein